MKVLVTGGAGFIGSHIADILFEEGHEVHVVDSLVTGNRNNVRTEIPVYTVDIRSAEMEELLKEIQPEIIVHQAAQASVPVSIHDPLQDLSLNIEASVKILELARVYGVRKVIYASSAAIYGVPQELPVTESHPIQPLSPYGISKFVPELYLHTYCNLYGIAYTAFRYGNVYGPRQNAKGEAGVIALFVDQILDGKTPVIQGTGEATRDFIYVRDVARAVGCALTDADNQIFNLSTNTAVSVNELYSLLAKLAGTDKPAEYGPPREGDILHSRLDNAKILSALRWKPEVALEEGLRMTIEWAIQQKG